jgi:hypothetical protein
MEANASGRRCRLSRVLDLRPARPGRARLGMTLEPLLLAGRMPHSTGHVERSRGLASESQGWDLVLTVLYVPCSLDSGTHAPVGAAGVPRSQETASRLGLP